MDYGNMMTECELIAQFFSYGWLQMGFIEIHFKFKFDFTSHCLAVSKSLAQIHVITLLPCSRHFEEKYTKTLPNNLMDSPPKVALCKEKSRKIIT
jgi:hypothetical protein